METCSFHDQCTSKTGRQELGLMIPTPVSLCACGMHMYECVCERERERGGVNFRGQCLVPSSVALHFLRQCLSLNPELTILVTLDDH